MFERLRRGAWMDRLLLAAAIVLFLAALIWPLAFALALTEDEESLLFAYERGEIIRLHVVAHSDDPLDQQIKLEVRDALLKAFGAELKQAGAESSQAAYALLCSRVSQMEEIARDRARSLGFLGEVRAEAGVLHLPAKTYGSVTLPQGAYRALRLTLGEGKGQNWWCVLFPQLCLALAGEEAPEAAPEWNLARVLRCWTLCSVQKQ